MAKVVLSNWSPNVRQRWAADWEGTESLLPAGGRVVASAFPATDAASVTLTANALVGAAALVVAALANSIPQSTLLFFASGKTARTTAFAASGATSVPVEALTIQINSGDAAVYPGVQPKTILSGTLLGRTFAERAAGTGYGPWTTGDDDVYLAAFDVTDAAQNPDVELYRRNRVVKETALPEWAARNGDATGWLAAVRTNYQTIRGVD